MCEPLRGKLNYIYDNYFYVNDVKSAVEFYKRYKFRMENPENPNQGYYLLKTEQPEAFKEYINIISVEYKNYNNWLFDYCFGDVI